MVAATIESFSEACSPANLQPDDGLVKHGNDDEAGPLVEASWKLIAETEGYSCPSSSLRVCTPALITR